MLDARSADRLICCWVTCKGLVLVMIGVPGHRQKRGKCIVRERVYICEKAEEWEITHTWSTTDGLKQAALMCDHPKCGLKVLSIAGLNTRNHSLHISTGISLPGLISSIISVSVMRETKLTRHHSLLLPSLYHFHLFHMMWGVHEWMDMDGVCVRVCVLVCMQVYNIIMLI